MITRFGPWTSLADAGARAPRAPGVYQLRVASGLIAYPTGKSAMVHYAAAPDLRAAIATYAAAHPDAPYLCRYQSCPDPDALCNQLRERFIARFGCAPRP